MRQELEVFIGSSSEALRQAKEVVSALEQVDGIQPVLWKDIFGLGSITLSAIEEASDRFSGAVFLATPDDDAEIREERVRVPRANVLFEYGYLLAKLGRPRVALCAWRDVELPSDFAGLAYASMGQFDANSDLSPRALNILTEWARNLALAKEAEPRTLRRLRECWRPFAEKRHEDFKLFSFYGLWQDNEWEHKAEDKWLEQVYYLWANASSGSWIRAKVVQTTDPKNSYLRIIYSNRENGFPCNVAIRPSGKKLISNPWGKPFEALRFKARVPADCEALFDDEKPRDEDSVPVLDAGLNIRLVDALLTHWEYCRRPTAKEYNMLRLPRGCAWKEFTIPLSSHRAWIAFDADGNYLYHSGEPDFSQVIAVVIEVGDANGSRAGKGAGVIELKDFEVGP